MTELSEFNLIKCSKCGEISENECKWHTLIADCIFCDKSVTLDGFGNCPINAMHVISNIKTKYNIRPFEESKQRCYNLLFSTRLNNFRLSFIRSFYKYFWNSNYNIFGQGWRYYKEIKSSSKKWDKFIAQSRNFAKEYGVSDYSWNKPIDNWSSEFLATREEIAAADRSKKGAYGPRDPEAIEHDGSGRARAARHRGAKNGYPFGPESPGTVPPATGKRRGNKHSK